MVWVVVLAMVAIFCIGSAAVLYMLNKDAADD